MRIFAPSLVTAAAALTGCATETPYYVSNVFQHGADLYVQRCAIDAGRASDKPDPSKCHIEHIGDLPPEYAAQIPNSAPVTSPPPPVSMPTH